MIRSVHFTRAKAVLRITHRLEQDSYPRLQMSLIVGLTGASGLLFSFLMLQAGVTSMTLRYPLALLLAYGFFLLLLWLWLRTKDDDYTDLPDLINLVPSPGPGGGPIPFQGGGGSFGGGGASGSFDGPALPGSAEPDISTPLGEAVGAVGEADELAVPIVAAIFAIGVALASLYVVYVAPMLFAELLVDGVLSYALYRKIKGAESPHWLASAIRRTAIPFLLTGVFVAIVGASLSVYAPEAHSIGQALQQARQP